MDDAPKKSWKRGRKKKVYPLNLKRANELRAKEAAAVHEFAEQSPNLQQEKYARLPVEAQKQAAHAFFYQAAQAPELTEKEVVKDTAQRLGTLSYLFESLLFTCHHLRQHTILCEESCERSSQGAVGCTLSQEAHPCACGGREEGSPPPQV